MKDPTQEDLIGYVLGALDADEQTQIQHLIDSDPQLDDRLLEVQAQMAPLEHLSEPSGMRPGLARRTCEMVAGYDAAQLDSVNLNDANANITNAMDGHQSASRERVPATLATAKFSQSAPSSLHRWSSWSMRDFLVAAAAVAVLASLLFPMLVYSKHRANLVHCSNNLQSLGRALGSYSEFNEGRFVEIPTEGPLAFAGVIAPILKEASFIESDNLFTCAAVSRDKPFVIPSTDQIRRCSTSEQGDYLRRVASGDYGYSFGYMDNGKYHSPRNMGRPYAVIAADKPSTRSLNGPSENHGGDGQNCLFEDLSVRYIKGNAIDDDQIYVNSYNVVGPGVSARDSVIGASHLSPLSASTAYIQAPLAE